MINWRTEIKTKEIIEDKTLSLMSNAVPFVLVTNSAKGNICFNTTYRRVVKAEISTQASSSLGVFGERFRFSRRKTECWKLIIITQYRTLSKVTNQRLLESKNIQHNMKTGDDLTDLLTSGEMKKFIRCPRDSPSIRNLLMPKLNRILSEEEFLWLWAQAL